MIHRTLSPLQIKGTHCELLRYGDKVIKWVRFKKKILNRMHIKRTSYEDIIHVLSFVGFPISDHQVCL